MNKKIYILLLTLFAITTLIACDKSDKSSANQDEQSNIFEDDTNTVNPTDVNPYPYLKSIGIDPEKPHNAYQLLVYSFFDSDGDGYGDLKGVEEKLDYIENLGSDIIWLSPIMSAESYHGYDILSFYTIDEKLGTIEDYKSLVNEAHKRDIKILLDMPINHTSINHEWFQAYLNDDDEYTEYYQEYNPSVQNGNTSSMGEKAKFYTDSETGKTYFAAFGETMPDLNYQSEELVNAIKDVFKYWIELGADGFRFDAVKHIFDPNEIPATEDSIAKNNELFQYLGEYIKSLNKDIYLLGENYSGQAEVKQYAESFDSEFDFETWHTGLGAVTNNDPWGFGNSRVYYDDTLVNCTNELLSINSNWIASFMTGNHDTTRAGSYIGDKVLDDEKALKLYASMVTLRSGIPFIYYGDELGLYGENKNGWNDNVGDAEVRLPMTFSDSTIDIETVFYSEADNGQLLGANILADWPTLETDNPQVDDQINNPDSLYATYQELIKFRNSNPAIYKGIMEQVGDYAGNATIYKTSYADETLYIAFNFSENAIAIKDLTTSELELVFSVNNAEASGYDLNLPARGVAVFTCDEDITITEVSNYALIIYPQEGEKYYVQLTMVDEFEGFIQYLGDNVYFNEGDIITLYNNYASEEWIEDNLSSWSVDGFISTSEGIKCIKSGTYDIYVKFKYEQDEIYIGNQ